MINSNVKGTTGETDEKEADDLTLNDSKKRGTLLWTTFLSVVHIICYQYGCLFP